MLDLSSLKKESKILNIVMYVKGIYTK